METTLEIEKIETPTFDIEKLDPAQLPELKGLKEKQLQIVKENPFTEITDNTSFEVAKKSRTILVSARTDIEKQDKLIASKITKFRKMVGDVNESLIAITRPHEEKQQNEVRRYEAIKENERLEKIRIENERIEKIKDSINTIYNSAVAKIDNLKFDVIESLKVDFEQNLYTTPAAQFDEFSTDFSEKLEIIKQRFSAKEIQLNELEVQRLEAERLRSEKLKFEEEQKAFAEKERLANEKAAAEQKRIQDEQKAQQDKIDAERKKFEAEQKIAQKKIDDERKKLEDEKNALAKAESDKKEKAEADRLAAEKAENDRVQAEARAARLEALKPEKLKACDFLNSLKFNTELPVVTDTEILILIENFIDETDQKRNDLIMHISNL